jgi:hypothetical protein
MYDLTYVVRKCKVIIVSDHYRQRKPRWRDIRYHMLDIERI